MTHQFQVYQQATGDIVCADGVVVDVKSGDVFRVGGDPFATGGPVAGAAADHLKDSIEAPQGATGTFLGGSGRNIIVSGLSTLVSGPLTPNGIYWPERPDFYNFGAFEIEVIGPSSATISDGVDIVAELTSGGTAPVGSYASTTYGADTYNGGSAFTLTVTGEGGTPADIPAAIVTISSGTAQGGTYTATDTANYVSDDDPDWTLVVAADGSAELRQTGTAVALRAAGLGYDPAGSYESTEAAASLNPVYDDETAANVDTPWTATIQVRREVSRAGFVYLTITESAGAVTDVTGPFFATSIPTPGAGESHVTIAQTDGIGGVEQLVTGPVLWVPGQGLARAITWGTVADSTASGAAGDVSMDADYLYGAIETDTWARIAWDATPWP